MRLRLLLPVLLFLLALVGVTASRGRAQDTVRTRPNVLLILVDDMGYECLGVNGSASYRTPNIDRLAATGARFTHCYTPPLCTPTRVQMMTGRYNFRNYTRFGALPQGEKTFAQMLKLAGYRTAVAGKWQLDEDGQTPREAGFDEYCLWNYREAGETAMGPRYADPNLISLDPRTGKAALRKWEGEYGPDVCDRYLADFIGRSVRDKTPFLAYYPMIITHDPFQPTPDSPEWKQGMRHQTAPRFYKDMVEYMDGLVGKMVKRLDDLGVRENTLILFTTDNGTVKRITSTMTDGRKLDGGKGLLTDAGSHVPLIVNQPGTVPAGQVRDDLVDTSDVLPTLAEVAGTALPRPPGDGVIDGRSFLPLAKGQKTRGREWVVVDYRAVMPRVGKQGDGRYARDRRWKLYGFAVSGAPVFKSGELYDMQRDPEEKTPVPAGDAEADAARRRLQGVLDTMKATPAPATQ